MQQFFVVGLNHKTAPVELRERCRADALEGAETLREWVLLTTCNRFEVYGHGAADHAAILARLAQGAGADADEFAQHAYVRTGRNAAKHLFLVAASLDSLVVGETQIRRQLRDAYKAAGESGTVGPMLHRLFQAALRVSKEIAERTGVGRGSVSVAGAAADLAARVFNDLERAQVLVVGAGETARLLVSHLSGRGVGGLRVVNRTVERARELAESFGATWGGLDDLGAEIGARDVVVTAASADEPLLTASDFKRALRQRRGKPMVVIDVAMPRAVDPAVDSLDNVYRYDMSDLEKVTTDALRRRRKDFLECCSLIDVATLRLETATRGREAGALIRQVQEQSSKLAEEEIRALERRFPDLDDSARDAVRKTIRRVVNKLLHRPMRVLRDGDPQESEVIYKTFAAGSKEDES